MSGRKRGHLRALLPPLGGVWRRRSLKRRSEAKAHVRRAFVRRKPVLRRRPETFEEVLRLSHKVGVLRDRRLIAELPNDDTLTTEVLMQTIASGGRS